MSLIVIWAGANALVGIQGVGSGWWGDISLSVKNISSYNLIFGKTAFQYHRRAQDDSYFRVWYHACATYLKNRYFVR